MFPAVVLDSGAAVPRFFNTTGPCYPEQHYFLPAETRVRQAQLDRYIQDELYWELHAPLRLSGNTRGERLTWNVVDRASGAVTAVGLS